jgi:hypothetical protein
MDMEKQRRDHQSNDPEPSAEYWKAKADCLQEIVCLLLMKNQVMRFQQMARK